MSKDESTSLLGRVIKETLSFSALSIVGQLFLMGSNIVLARILSARDFGIYDICVFLIGFGMLFGDVGLGAALLRKPTNPTPEEYQSVFTANLCVGAVLALGMGFGAPLIARAYGFVPGAVWVLIAMAPTYLLTSVRIYPLVRLERDIRFGAIARIELIVLVIRQASAVTLALSGFGVWALVGANIANSVLMVMAMLWVMPGLPKLRFEWSVFKPLFAFGVKVQALAIAAFFKDNVSNALLGVVGGPALVGFFNFAMRYIQVPVLAVNALARVQLPTYARLQDQPEELYRAVRGALRLAFLIGSPFLLVMATGSEFLVPFIYGAKWSPSIPVAWALLINMFGGLAASPLFTLMQARNQAGTALVTFVLWTLSTWLFSGIAWVAGFGMAGIGWAHSIVTLVVTIVLLARADRSLPGSLFAAVWPPTLAAGIAAGIHFGLASMHASWTKNPLMLLVFPLAVFVIAELAFERKRVIEDARGLWNQVRKKPA